VSLVPVTARPNWATPTDIVRFSVLEDERLTLAEIAARVPGLPEAFWQYGVIKVGGQAVDPGLWPYARPRAYEGTELVVEILMMPGDGGNQIEQIVAQVAVIALAATASYFVGPWAGAVVAGAGQIAIGLLFAPAVKRPKHIRDAITYGVQGNPLRPLEQIPRVLGVMQYSPPFLAGPYSDLDNNDVIVRAVVGLCGNHQITDIRLNNSTIEDNEGVIELETREGDPSDTPITAVPYSAFEERPGQTLGNFKLSSSSGHKDELEDQDFPESQDPPWHSFAMRGDSDEFRIRLQFPSGALQNHSDSAEINKGGMPIRSQFRRRGTVDWTNGPEFHFYDESKLVQEFRQQIVWVFAVDPGYDIIPFSGPPIHIDFWTASYRPDYHGYIAYWHTEPRPGYGSDWQADDYFDPGSGTKAAKHVQNDINGFRVYLDPAVFPPGEYEIRLRRGWNYNWGLFHPNDYRYDDVGEAFFDYFDVGGVFKIVTDNQWLSTGVAVVDAVTSLSYVYPLPAASEVPLTLIAVAVKNGSINSISATFGSRVFTWNGVDWSTYEVSQNPAALYRHVLKDDLNAKPLPATIIDDDALQDWYEDCVTRGFECNYVAADSVENVLHAIATAGWAFPRQNEKWGVIVEHDRSGESIVQNFTPLNTRNFSSEKSFADIPHAILAEFVSETQDYTDKQRVVYGDGYDSASATLFQSIRYDSITDPDQIDMRALMDWRQMRYRQTRRTIEVGAEILMSQRGDLVGLTHDVVGRKFFYGVVDAVLNDGVNVTGLRLNAVAELSQAGGACGVMVRYEDLTILEAPINEMIDTDTITFTTPFAIPVDNVLAEGCLVALGLAGLVYKRMLVFDVRPAQDFGARVVLVDEAPEIFTGPASERTYSLDFSKKRDSFYLPLAA
jgi:hypothetical protein